MVAVLIVLAVLVWPGAAPAGEAARALDGDTIELAGRVMDLYGIDAPESTQVCARGGQPWACGREAARVLDRLVHGRAVRCMAVSAGAGAVPRGICKAGDFDLAAEMVNRGLAVLAPAEANPYLANLREARAVGMGMFGGLYVEPRAWRTGSRLAIEPSSNDQAPMATSGNTP